MQLAYSDGRPIAAVTGVLPQRPIGSAPVEFSAQISEEGAKQLKSEPAAFYRATEGEERFTLTIDTVQNGTIAGTIRRR
jgi:hypothetical protein